MAVNPYGSGDPTVSTPMFNNPYASPLAYLNQPTRPLPVQPQQPQPQQPQQPQPGDPKVGAFNPTPSLPVGAGGVSVAGTPPGGVRTPGPNAAVATPSLPVGVGGASITPGGGARVMPPMRTTPVSLPPQGQNPAAQPSWWQSMFGLGGNRGMTAMLLDRAGGSGQGATRI